MSEDACPACSELPPTAEAIRFDLAWRTPTVLAIARGIFQDRDFSALPILADALEDAGCDNLTLLEHCRRAGAHGPTCWGLSLIVLGPPPPVLPPSPPTLPEPSVLVEAIHGLMDDPKSSQDSGSRFAIALIGGILAGFMSLSFSTPHHFAWWAVTTLGIVGSVYILTVFRVAITRWNRRHPPH